MFDLEQIRADLPVLERIGYWNTGTAGPLPRPVQEAMRNVLERELLQSRIHLDHFLEGKEMAEQIRRHLCGLFGGTPEEWALTHHTTEGINRVLAGFDWQEGDQIVTSNLEHAGVLVPLAVLQKRRGVRIKRVDLGLGSLENRPVERILEAIDERTKLCVLSHVAYTSGARLPLEELTSELHRSGIPLLVDGAQSAGSIPVDLNEWPVDFYSIPGQKWLCGPEGSGALFVRASHQERLQMSESGYASVASYDEQGGYVPREGAARYEVGTRNKAVLAGQLAALQWLSRWNLQDCQERIATLAGKLRGILMETAGVELLTPENHAGLVTFRIRNKEPQQIVKELADKNQWIRTIDELQAVRISVGFFHKEEEVAAWPGWLRGLFH